MSTAGSSPPNWSTPPLGPRRHDADYVTAALGQRRDRLCDPFGGPAIHRDRHRYLRSLGDGVSDACGSGTRRSSGQVDFTTQYTTVETAIPPP